MVDLGLAAVDFRTGGYRRRIAGFQWLLEGAEPTFCRMRLQGLGRLGRRTLARRSRTWPR
jgi:hypothetical protein